MNFKEAFEHYKAGTATGEERACVEQELEKNRLISEYLAEDFTFEVPVADIPAGELKNVKKSIRKRSRNIAAVTIVIIAALTLLIKFALIPLLNSLYIDPTAREINGFTYDIDFSLVAYTELHFPGYYYGGTIIDNTGIGQYNMTLYRYDLTKGEEEFVSASLDRNIMTAPYSFTLSNLPVNIFARASTPNYSLDRENREAYEKELEELPDYMNVTAAVSFSEDLTMEQLIDFMNRGNVSCMWAGIRNSPDGVQRYPLCGMDLTGAGVIYEDVNDTYPAFELSNISGKETLSAADYETHFTSLLRFLADHPEFLNILKPDTDHAGYYQSVLDYVTENGVKTYGVMVQGSASEILALRDNENVSQLWPLNAEIVF
jgi:hypothetical protein